MKFVCQKKKKKNERIYVEELYYYDSSVNSIGSKSRRKVAVERYMPRTIYRAASRLNVKGKVAFQSRHPVFHIFRRFNFVNAFQRRQKMKTDVRSSFKAERRCKLDRLVD